MGLSLKCEKTGSEYSLGYGGFLVLRKKVALLCNDNFGKCYDAAFSFSATPSTVKFCETIANNLIDKKVISKKVVSFLFQSDLEGRISYGACKDLYKVIKDYDDNVCYGYAPSGMKFKDFIVLVKECYDNKSDLVWG